MNLTDYTHQALINLMAAKLRSFLAVLGILVGTAAVVVLMSCGQLATERALAEFKALGTDLLAVTTFPQANENRNYEGIPLDFWRRLPQLVPGVIDIAPYATAYQEISYQGKKINGVIIGADESLKKIIHINLAKGHFVSFVDNYEHYCVIGETIKKQIQEFSVDNLIDKQIQIGKNFYTIIGITSPWKENGFFNEDINQSIIIPINGVPLISKDSKINNAILLLKPEINIDETIQLIKSIINKQAPTFNVFIRSAKQIIASMENQGHIFTLLLAIIGSISLVVGGIGIMNVMLVSVSERKKEIGIRKAVGAENKAIQLLFLIESVLLSIFGGTFGILLGIIVTWFVAYFSGWHFVLFLTPLIVGFVVSVLTGIFFGYYPALRASKLDPIVSLRSE